MHPSPELSTTESILAAVSYLAARGKLNRPVSFLFSDARHAEALRRQAAARSLRWTCYRETERTGLAARVRTWWRSY